MPSLCSIDKTLIELESAEYGVRHYITYYSHAVPACQPHFSAHLPLGLLGARGTAEALPREL